MCKAPAVFILEPWIASAFDQVLCCTAGDRPAIKLGNIGRWDQYGSHRWSGVPIVAADRALSCPKGGFPILRHNEVRDLTANIMDEVCHDVCIEPSLQPLTGETLSGASAKVEDGARLDIAASGFWGGRHDRAFFDVRVFNPHATSNQQPIATCYRKHENSKKRDYERRVREIERGSFTPLVLSLTGGLGNAAIVDSPQCSLPNVINHTVAPCPG